MCIFTLILENIYLTGSVPALQNWNTDTALLMSPNNYPVWSGELSPWATTYCMIIHTAFSHC